MSCKCRSGYTVPEPCPVHWPDGVVRSIKVVAAKASGVVDQLARDRETIATEAINTLGELLLPHVPYMARGLVQQLWTQFAPVAVERATIQAASVTVVDERGPGSTVDLVDERGQ